MGGLIKSALINSQLQSTTCFNLRFACFHSTPILERGRRNQWNTRYNNSNNYRRSRRNPSKQNIMRDINAYAEYLINNWQSGIDPDEQPSNKGPSWFRQPPNGPRGNWTRGQGSQRGKRGRYNFCDDDDDEEIENVFRAEFGDRFFFWSFVNEDYSNRRRSSGPFNSYKNSWRRRQQGEDEYDDDYTSEDDTSRYDLVSERRALGLNASGPLKLADVKTAYRACALKWHPDRHQGSSKEAAEEKFKHCTAAYQSLCGKLAVD